MSYGPGYPREEIEVTTLQGHLHLHQRQILHPLEIRGRVEATLEHMARGMVVDVEAEFLCEEPFEERETVHRTFKVPDTWWDQLKEERLPDWFTRRWPAQYRNVTVDVDCPVKRYVVHPEHEISQRNARLQIIKDSMGCDRHEAEHFERMFQHFKERELRFNP